MERTLLQQVLELPDAERAAMALELIRSLSPVDSVETDDQSIRAAWSEEIEARIDSIVKGKVTLVDWETAMEEDRLKVANGDLD